MKSGKKAGDHHAVHEKARPGVEGEGVTSADAGAAGPVSGEGPETGAGPAPTPVAAPDAEAVWTERLARVQADFENYRKRTNRDRAETARRARGELLVQILPVLDHLEKAIEQAAHQGAAPAFIEGLQLVRDEFRNTLLRFGVTPIEATGAAFDPARHEAVSQVISAEHPDGTVVEDVRRGYLLDGTLLRATQVVVSARPAPESAVAAAGDTTTP